MRWAALVLVLAAGPAPAQEMRDPAAVTLPATAVLELKLGSAAPVERYRALFDAMAPTGALPVLGPGVTPAIRAAADRARVWLAWLQYDLNGDGAVTRHEFDNHAEVSWGRDELAGGGQAILDGEWTEADTDRDGAVRAEEIAALALAAYPVPDSAPLGPDALAIVQMDLDGDAFVIWDEVEAVLAAHR